MGNTSSELNPMNNTNEKVQKTMNTLKQGRILLENRSTIADTETERLEGFTDMAQPSTSSKTVINELKQLENELQNERKKLETLENEYKELVQNNSGSDDDIKQIKDNKKTLDDQHDKVKTLTAKINKYIQHVAIQEINDTKQSINTNETYIRSNTDILTSDTGNAKIPAIYYALNENVHVLERMRYYWYVVYLLVFLGVILLLYMMGIGFGTVVKQVQKVPQTINKAFESII